MDQLQWTSVVGALTLHAAPVLTPANLPPPSSHPNCAELQEGGVVTIGQDVGGGGNRHTQN
jgi:hypothetical protein